VRWHMACMRSELVGYLTMLSVSSLHTIADRTINTSGAVGGIRIDGGNLCA
jgi:hypothetical protein